MQYDFLFFRVKAAIEHGKPLQHQSKGLDDEGQIGQPYSLALDQTPLPLPDFPQGQSVGPLHDGDGNGAAGRNAHRFRHRLAHPPERKALVGRRLCVRRLASGPDVVLGDAPAGTAPLQRSQIDTQFRSQLAVPGQDRQNGLSGRGRGRRLRRFFQFPDDAERRRPFLCFRLRCGRFFGLLDHRQHGADGDRIADRTAQLADHSGDGGRQLHHRLVRFHFDDRLVGLDPVAIGDQPANDLPFGNPLPDVGELEFEHEPSR